MLVGCGIMVQGRGRAAGAAWRAGSGLAVFRAGGGDAERPMRAEMGRGGEQWAAPKRSPREEREFTRQNRFRLVTGGAYA